MKRSYFIHFLAVCLFWLSGCSGSNTVGPTPLTEEDLIIEEIETGYQKTSFLLTDAPSDDFKSVYVDIQSPIVVETNTGVVYVPLPDDAPIRVDLLALNGVSGLLTRHAIPAGTIQKITLTLAHPEIIRVDDTPLSALNTTPLTLTLNPSSPIVIQEKQGDTVEIDIDVEKSIQLDVTNKTPIFKPEGTVHSFNRLAGGGIERASTTVITGNVAEMPGIKGQKGSFLLRHPEKRLFVPVDVSQGVTYNPAGTTFESLAKGQRVRVSGVFTSDGVIQAQHVAIIYENHQVAHGILANLDPNQHIFDLRPFSDNDRLATQTLRMIYATETDIRLERPESALTPADLTNGQIVSVHYFMNSDGTSNAELIVVHPERFLGFIASTNCGNQQIDLIYPPQLIRRISSLAGIDHLSNLGIVEIGEPVLDLQRNVVNCADLQPKTAVTIFGRMIPPLADGKIRVKAFHVLETSVSPIQGKIRGIVSGSSFEMEVSEGFNLDKTGCTTDCVLPINVEWFSFLGDPGNIIQVGNTVQVMGFFGSRITTTGRRAFYLRAVKIDLVQRRI